MPIARVFLGDVPMTQEVMAKMDKEERLFWDDFFSLAHKEIKSAEKIGDEKPFMPSKKLKEEFYKAIEKYNGDKYCPVRQIALIFDFNQLLH